MVHAAALLVIVLVAAPLALNVPLAALAGILAFVAWNMGEWREFARLKHFNLPYRVILVGTFLLTVIFDLLYPRSRLLWTDVRLDASLVTLSACETALGSDLLGGSLIAALAVVRSSEVVDDHLGALLGEQQRVLPADPASGTGDDRDSSVE